MTNDSLLAENVREAMKNLHLAIEAATAQGLEIYVEWDGSNVYGADTYTRNRQCAVRIVHITRVTSF